MNISKIKDKIAWKIKQKAAGESRYYGDGGTIHHTGVLDIETYHGDIVAVWFRCQMLPFKRTEVRDYRAASIGAVAQDTLPIITGVEVLDKR